jgi:hypothetical protein
MRPHLRWMFAVTPADANSEATVFTGPTYVGVEHDSVDAVQALVDDWWETTKIVGDANDRARPRIRRGS